MLIALFIFELILVGLTILTTHMVEHKLYTLQASLGMYCNKRTYKTKADIDFIESIITSYKNLVTDTDEEPDLESAIKRRLQYEYIGRFSYVSVKNIALKGKNLMWGVLAIEGLVVWMNQMQSYGQAVRFITASLLLTVIMVIYVMIKRIDEKSEALIDEVIHYIKNIYPLEKISQKKESLGKGITISLEAHKEKKAGKVPGDKEQVCEDRAHDDKQKNSQHIRNSESKESSLNKTQMQELSAKDIAKLLDRL